MAKKLKPQQEREVRASLAISCYPNGQKIDAPGSGVLPIFEWQIASYDRPPSGERFENLSMRSVQIRAHDGVRSRSALLAYYSRSHAPTRVDSQFTLPLDNSTAKVRPTGRGIALVCRDPFC